MSIELDNSQRYHIYGTRPGEHEDDNSDTPSEQKVAQPVVICSTDDRDEAKRIVRVGGFTHNEEWYAATGAKDSTEGGTIGHVPTGV